MLKVYILTILTILKVRIHEARKSIVRCLLDSGSKTQLCGPHNYVHGVHRLSQPMQIQHLRMLLKSKVISVAHDPVNPTNRFRPIGQTNQ